MYTCAKCGVVACVQKDKDMPANCPMHERKLIKEIIEKYLDPDTQNFTISAAATEAQGYGEWPRLREVMELCRRLGYKKIGMAFCHGLLKESRIINQILEKNGFEVVSIICKTGGFDKREIGIPQECMIDPSKQYEIMCNPIAQAEFLNSQNTDFNIVVGLCVGHDSLFMKHVYAYTTTLIAKDRLLLHNPAAAVYCHDGYVERRIMMQP